MKTTFSTLLASCLLTIGAADVFASPLVSGWSQFGPGTVTIDTATGLSWLDVTLTTQFSHDEMQDQLATNDEFSGFRLATMSEVIEFWEDAGIAFGGGFVPENYVPIRNLMDFVGITKLNVDTLGDGKTFDLTAGHTIEEIVGIPGYEGWVYVLSISALDEEQTGKASSGSVPSYNDNDGHGSWLVADFSLVPEPSSLTLFGLGVGIAGVGMLCRRRRDCRRTT